MPEGLVVDFELLFFVLRHEILEPLLILLIELGIQLFIVEIPFTGIVDAPDEIAQPTARAGKVSQDTLLVAGGTERC